MVVLEDTKEFLAFYVLHQVVSYSGSVVNALMYNEAQSRGGQAEISHGRWGWHSHDGVLRLIPCEEIGPKPLALSRQWSGSSMLPFGQHVPGSMLSHHPDPSQGFVSNAQASTSTADPPAPAVPCVGIRPGTDPCLQVHGRKLESKKSNQTSICLENKWMN